MAYEFLNETTQEPQIAQQEQILNMLASQSASADPNDLSNLEEIQEQDMNDLVSINDEQSPEEHEELSDADADRMATDTHDFENEELDPIDYQLMGYLMGDNDQTASKPAGPKMQTGGYGGVSTVYNESSAPYLKNRIDNIKFASLNRPTSKYKPILPQNPDKQQLRNQATQIIQNDPIAQKMGVRVPTAQYGGLKYDNEGVTDIGQYQHGGYSYSSVSGRHAPITRKSYGYGGAYKMDSRNSYQTGGNTLYAETEKTLRRGLNDGSYNRAVLNLKGDNIIRGLDNHQPVAVTDGSKYKILRGPHDTDNFNGKVFEKRL